MYQNEADMELEAILGMTAAVGRIAAAWPATRPTAGAPGAAIRWILLNSSL